MFSLNWACVNFRFANEWRQLGDSTPAVWMIRREKPHLISGKLSPTGNDRNSLDVTVKWKENNSGVKRPVFQRRHCHERVEWSWGSVSSSIKWGKGLDLEENSYLKYKDFTICKSYDTVRVQRRNPWPSVTAFHDTSYLWFLMCTLRLALSSKITVCLRLKIFEKKIYVRLVYSSSSDTIYIIIQVLKKCFWCQWR